MQAHSQNWMTWIAAGLTAVIVLSTSIYTLACFTGVPYMDMFDGTLYFYTKFSQGNWFSLWEQHNEHRIVLSKLLFLINMYLANGTTPFLEIIELGLAASMACLLVLFSQKIVAGPLLSILNLSIIALCFSMGQEQNFSSVFQSQFFLVYVLPLMCMYFAHRAVQDGRDHWRNFAISTVCAVLSALSMANGVFAVPMLLVYGILMNIGWRRIAILVMVSALVFVTYLYNYHSVQGHTDPLTAIRHPIALLEFVCVYMGHSMLVGFVIILASIYAFGYYLSKRKSHSAETALLGFIGFVILSAFITALGRVGFGQDAARSSRYATPAIAMIASLFILYRPLLALAGRWSFLQKPETGVLFLFLLVTGQKETLVVPPKQNFNAILGALALELRAQDQEIVGAIYPASRMAWAIETSAQARADHLMIWGMAPIRDSKLLYGSHIAVPNPQDCLLSVEMVTKIDMGQRINGWLGLPAATNEMIYLTDQSGAIFGVGLIGDYRPDISKLHPELNQRTGFGLYTRQDLRNIPLFIGTRSHRCPIPKTGLIQ